MMKKAGTPALLSGNDVAVVMSPRERLRQDGGDCTSFTRLLYQKSFLDLYRSGAAFDMLTLEDYVANPRKYKKVVFLNAFYLTKEERGIIETGIRNGSTKSAIADTLGKEKSTIGKEIKEHRKLRFRSSLPRPCANYGQCRLKRKCTANCSGFVEFRCSRRDRSPGACNGCSNYTHCRFDKYYYDANEAQLEYEELRTASRVGVNLTEEELKNISETVVPLLNKGQSPYHVISNHPELKICEKTLYNYIDNHVFSLHPGPNVFQLRRKPGRKPSKKYHDRDAALKKRQDK